MTRLDGDNADRYRVQVGRYNERWYTWDGWQGPAVSTVKKASGSDWSNVAIKRIAAALDADPTLFADMDVEQMTAAMRRINADGLTAAAGRGIRVHTAIEQRLRGEPVTVDVGEYAATVDRIFDELRPEPVLMETVAIERTLHDIGYGGTLDALVTVAERDGIWLVDWKSRGADSRHSAYSQEAAQLGGYYAAEALIVDDALVEIPALAGGLIVSIRPDGDYAVYPIDLDAAAAHWRDMHAWWVARRSERDSIGRMWPRKKNATPPEANAGGVDESAGSISPDPALELAQSVTEWGEALRRMLAEDWPFQLPTPGAVRRGEATWAGDDLELARATIAGVAPAFTEADTAHVTPAPRPAPVEPPPVARDEPADPDALADLLARIKDSPCRSIVNGWLHEANAVGRSWSPRVQGTLRNYEIARAAYWLASIIADAPEDSTDADFVELVRHIIGRHVECIDAIDQMPIGVLLALVKADEARAIADDAQSVVEGALRLLYTDDGPTLVAA